MRAWIMLVALAAVIAVWATQPASAARTASPAEADTIGAVFGALPFCSDVEISTVDETFASWSLVEGGCGFRDPRTNIDATIIVAHYENWAWHDFYQASSAQYACEAGGIPPGVGTDLKVCQPASKRIYVVQSGQFRYRPRLLLQGAHGAYTRLDWRGWGKPTATARGTFTYSDAYDHFRAPVTVRLSYVAFCGTRRIYLHLKVTARKRSDRQRLRFATGVREMSCEN